MIQIDNYAYANHCVKIKVKELCGTKINLLFPPNKYGGASMQINTVFVAMPVKRSV
jgi:hypothetical protein